MSRILIAKTTLTLYDQILIKKKKSSLQVFVHVIEKNPSIICGDSLGVTNRM